MFKKLCTFIILAVLLAVGPALAGNTDANWGKNRGMALTDTVTWKATSLLGSKVRVDSLVYQTVLDTTLAIEYSGVQDMSVTWLADAKGADLDLTIYTFVSPDGFNAWSPLVAVADMDSATPGRAGIANDTITQPLIIRFSGVADSVVAAAAAAINYSNPLGRDFRKLATNRYIRFIVSPAMAATSDTVYLTGILTRIYPL